MPSYCASTTAMLVILIVFETYFKVEDVLLIAMNLIFVACILYTIGVWSEKIQDRLKAWQLLVFWLGLFFSTFGTGAIGISAGSLIQFNFHSITGSLTKISSTTTNFSGCV